MTPFAWNGYGRPKDACFCVEPGSVHDITAARLHALPALYPAAAAGLPALADPDTTAQASAFTSRSSSPQADGSSISIPAPATRCSGRCAVSASAGSPCSPAAGAPCSTSPPPRQDRRYRPCSPGPHSFRVRRHQMKWVQLLWSEEAGVLPPANRPCPADSGPLGSGSQLRRPGVVGAVGQ